MRKFIVLFSILFIAFNAQSQRWVDIGIKGGWGPNWLFNKNVMNDQEFTAQMAFGHNFGGKLGFNFNENHEITFDVMASVMKYKFKFNEYDSSTHSSPLYAKTLQYNTVDFILMYRHNNDGRYMEIGPAYSLVKKASGTNTYETNADGTIKDNLISSYTSMVLGFGSYFMGTENFGITLGARFSYTFNDLISPKGQTLGYPSTGTTYPSYSPSHPFTAMLIAEANLDFAYVVRAKCKSKTKLIIF